MRRRLACAAGALALAALVQAGAARAADAITNTVIGETSTTDGSGRPFYGSWNDGTNTWYWSDKDETALCGAEGQGDPYGCLKTLTDIPKGAREFHSVGKTFSVDTPVDEVKDDGGEVNVTVSGGTYTVTIADEADSVYENLTIQPYSPLELLSSGGPAAPWASGLSLASVGSDGVVYGSECTRSDYDPYDACALRPNGGNGGDISLNVTDPVTITLDGTNLPTRLPTNDDLETFSLTLNGVTALSKGGANSAYWKSGLGQNAYYSAPGTAGKVDVTFKGNITFEGSYDSDAGPLISQTIGISAISLGGDLKCVGGYDCLDSYYNSNNDQIPGAGKEVTVNLNAGSNITLQQGSAIGIYAQSANGAIWRDSSYTWTQEYDVDTSSLRAGNVDVTVESGAEIYVGNENALFSVGVLAHSAGSAPTRAFSLANSLNYGKYDIYGGAAIGFDVNVTNAGVIDAKGTLALGIAALSTAADAIIGPRNAGPGEFNPKKTLTNYMNTLGHVTVLNSGTITTDGESSHGIVAGSLSSVGVVHILADERYDYGACNPTFEGAKKGSLPECDSSPTGMVLGASDDEAALQSGDSGVSAGAVTVTNSGTITTGHYDPDPDNKTGNHAMGIFAQSVGGGGGNGSGGFWFLAGDGGGSGGNGGAVTVTNSGTIATYGQFATSVLAQSIGGGGGVGGTTTVAPWVSVGGRAGLGGDGGNVALGLDGGTITTTGEFAQGALAQSIGGGGGVGGASHTSGIALAISVGGPGGGGGNGGSVEVTAGSDPGVNGIVTMGGHGAGILAQSIGGGGGTGGTANAYSASVQTNENMSFGGNGGEGGQGGVVDVFSDLSMRTEGAEAIGILAQSIGGGGGAGGAAHSRADTAEIPIPGVPSITFAGAFGGGGGEGGDGRDVTVNNGATVHTLSGGSIGLLAQSIGGGGGAGGFASAKDIAWQLPFGKLLSAAEGTSPAINVSMSLGGDGGEGGHGGNVYVTNANPASDRTSTPAGRILTEWDYAPGIVAQSIGGGGGQGGGSHTSVGMRGWANFLGQLTTLSKDQKLFAIDTSVSVGGKGGGGGNGGYVEANNGYNSDFTAGMISTVGGASPGMIVQSIGGGGGIGGEGNSNAPGGSFSVSVAVGGNGAVAGNGGEVYALNVRGATIKTGTVLSTESTPEEINEGSAPFVVVTRGASSEGILAQSIGGGGGKGGNADGSTALTDSWQSDVTLATKTLSKGLKAAAKLDWGVLGDIGGSVSMKVGGAGGAGGDSERVRVDNGGSIETVGEQSHGIHAQAIGGGGGTGGAVEASSVYWEAIVDQGLDPKRFGLGVEVGGGGGAGGFGNSVTVNHYTDAEVITHGYGANGIFAQSIGGGGGFGGSATAAADGTIAIGLEFSNSENEAAAGRGDVVDLSIGGRITTWGDDANGVLAHSIGGGGGSGLVGCTNSESGFSGGLGPWEMAAPCWGNNDSDTGDEPRSKTWAGPLEGSTSLSLEAVVGGGFSNTKDFVDGSRVTVEVTSAITTFGSRSMGVVAQSIGGGGGFLSGDATFFYGTNVAPVAGQSHSHGRTVVVDIDTGGSITTFGDGAWGVLAQSIGGSGGFVGDPSLSLGLLESNTVVDICCGKYDTGADGGQVTVNLLEGASVTTSGKNAHGIFAQSGGGGAGIAAGGDNDPNALVYAGNPLGEGWRGLPTDPDPPVKWTGQGGGVFIGIYETAKVEVNGEGSIGIIAQSTGNMDYQSLIDIYVAGTVVGGKKSSPQTDPGLGAAAILVSGGESGNNKHLGNDQSPNTIMVDSKGVVAGSYCDPSSPCPNSKGYDPDSTAIQSIFGWTSVDNYGAIYGSIKVCDSDGDYDGFLTIRDGATWWAGDYNCVAESSAYNYGVIHVTMPTTIEGSLKQYEGGELRISLDSDVHFDEHAITVTGLAQIDGTITPVTPNKLLSGEFKVLKAGTLEGSPRITDPLLYDWQLHHYAADNELRLSPLADFRPVDMPLSENQRSVADYLQGAWDQKAPALAKHFGYMHELESTEQYHDMLDALSGTELLLQHEAVLRATPTLLGNTIECPDTGDANVMVGEDTCTWLSVSRSWGRYSGADTRESDLNGQLFSLGVQKEFSPGWFAAGAIGRLSSDANADIFSISGSATIGSLGVKRQTGKWTLGASLARASGSSDSVRRFALPALGQRASEPDAVLTSKSNIDIWALRGRVSYEFGSGDMYLRPTLDLDVLRAKTSGFEEGLEGNLFRLRAEGDLRTYVVATPHVEIGRKILFGNDVSMWAYADVGVRLAPDADRELNLMHPEVGSAGGSFRSRLDVPTATGLLKLGAQVYRDKTLDVRLEYGLEQNSDFRNHTATARLAWHF